MLPLSWNFCHIKCILLDNLTTWVPISVFRPLCSVWCLCLRVVPLGLKSRCLGMPWLLPLLPGTGLNHHPAGFQKCIGFYIVTIGHSMMVSDFFKRIWNIPCLRPLSGLHSVLLLQCIFIETSFFRLWKIFCVNIVQYIWVTETPSCWFRLFF